MAYRLVARFDEKKIRTPLHHGRNIIGSDPSCEVCLPNPTVSRRHAAVTVSPAGFELEDLNSTNGTLLGSQRVERTELEVGDAFVVGRVVVHLEEVADEDLEVGIVLPREGTDPSGVMTFELSELTESFSPLDRFALDHLPRLLENCTGDADRQRMAQLLGYALFETMPATEVEMIETGSEEKGGVLYSAERPGDAKDEAHWIEAASEHCQVRVRFERISVGEHYRPLVDSGLLLLTLADRAPAPQEPAPRPIQEGVRPQPLSVDPEVRRTYDQAERVARGDVGVLICGESGTGKEVLATFIHSVSPRATQPFVTINCASLPRDLLEAELFGVEKGVATGVEARPGKFEAAHGGTIFLDEIGDMAPETQAKILRVLQEKEVFRLGGHTPRPAKARVISATNRPIRQMLADGTFRSDLYHRIATWEVELPPLRHRRADIPNLAAFFLSRETKRYGIRVRGISRAALKALRRYSWPGNIRQLRNEISRAALFLENKELLDMSRLNPVIRGEDHSQSGASLAEVLEAVERDEITVALEACGGDTAATAGRLKISRPTLYRRINKLKIDLPG